MVDKSRQMKIGVLFGGRSGEHDVSIVSGTTVMSHLDQSKYRVYALGIRRDGSFATAKESQDMLAEKVEGIIPARGVISSCASEGLIEIQASTEEKGTGEEDSREKLDLLFPVLHGPFGEDGTIQGLLEMTGRPYVGCGVAVSSCGMDKELTKRLLKEAGLPIIPYETIYLDEWAASRQEVQAKLTREMGTPCFVKPCRMGSSVGITRVNEPQNIPPALDAAFEYDYKVLIEPALDAREFECSVMGNRDIQVSHPGEILPSREFYDYSAKYLDGDASKLLIPAPVDEKLTGHLMDIAKQAFQSLGGEGFARVDFLLDRTNGSIFINEINTIPGFTEISMFPKLWVHEGRSITEVLDHLIELAKERHEWKMKLKAP